MASVDYFGVPYAVLDTKQQETYHHTQTFDPKLLHRVTIMDIWL